MTIHLILLIHGLYGSPKNLSVTAEELHKAALSNGSNASSNLSTSTSASTSIADEDNIDEGIDEKDEVVVHIAKSFTGSHTWDGVDVNAERAAKELEGQIERLERSGKRVDRVSIMGYSLGGREFFFLCFLLMSAKIWVCDIAGSTGCMGAKAEASGCPIPCRNSLRQRRFL